MIAVLGWLILAFIVGVAVGVYLGVIAVVAYLGKKGKSKKEIYEFFGLQKEGEE